MNGTVPLSLVLAFLSAASQVKAGEPPWLVREQPGPTWLCAIDLGTGQVKKQRLADGHQFYLSGRALGFDGKYYIATPSRKSWSMDLFVYDPSKPWNLGKGGPPGAPAPSSDNPRSNPHRMGEFDRSTRVAIMHASALGADGRIFDPVGWPTFVGRDVYLSGSEQLRRIRNVAGAP